MTLHASFIWKNPDATKDLNDRIRRIVNRGIVWGGVMNPAGAGLQVIVDPSVAVSFDGMTVMEDAQATLGVAAGERNYVVLWAKYNEGGVPATPTLMYQVMKEADYLIHPEKDYLIVYGLVDLAPAAVNVTLADIDFTVRDEIDPLGRDWYRGKVATPAALPLGPPLANRIGDFYFVDSDNTFHFWNGTIWEPLNTGSYNTETTAMNQMIQRAERDRIVDGTGIVSGIRPNVQGDFASNSEVGIEDTPTIADQIGINSFTALVNGHFVETHGQYVALDAKPGIGERFDIIFLEVWREAITVPELHGYARNPAGGATYDIQEVDDKLQTMQWKAGIPVAPTADNFNLNPMETYDHDFRVVKWRLATQSNLPSSVGLYNPADPTISGACSNIDANPFVSQPAGSGIDDRIWMAPSVTASDGYSWAIPLLVLRRTSVEAAPTAVQTFRDGVRYVFPVYPVTDATHAGRLALDAVHRDTRTPFGFDQYPYDEPSGFKSGLHYQMQTMAGSDNIQLFDDAIHVRVRGVDDWLTRPTPVTVDIGAAPAGVGSWVRTLVYLKMNVTLYDDGVGSGTVNQIVSQKHRPYIPSNVGAAVRGQGWKRGYVTWEYVVDDLGSNNYTDEDDAMTAAGWVRGDVTMAAQNAQYEDGGIWSRVIAIDVDDRVHPYAAEWAVPVALIHRRNGSPWDFATNPNGSTASRPDGRTDAGLTYPDDLLDLRREVDVTEEELSLRVQQDVDMLIKGQLRTRMSNKYLGAGTAGMVAGTRVLQTDSLGSVAGAVPLAAPDGYRKIWSDAKEFVPHAVAFDLDSDSSGGMYTYDYHPVAAPTEGYLKLNAYQSGGGTQYMQLVRQCPPCVYTVVTGATPPRYDFFGPPAWTSQEFSVGTYPDWGLSTARYIDNNDDPQNLYFRYYNDPLQTLSASNNGQGMLVVNEDATQKATEMEGYVNLTTPVVAAGSRAALSFWMHYDRSFAGSPYSANYGLTEIPDEVHRVILDPGGTDEQVHLGMMYTVVRKPIAAASITITQADVTTASGVPGTVEFVGFDRLSIRIDDPLFPVLPFATGATMSAARDQIDIAFPAVFTGNLEVIVFFKTSDVDKWVEIGRGGKSVRAVFEWNENEINFTVPPGVGRYVYDIGESTWHDAYVGAQRVENPPILWTRPDAVSDYTLLKGERPENAENSNHVHLNTDGDYDTRVLSIVPAWRALTPAEEMVIHYTYTPYQGLSSSGGKAVPATAVPKLRTLLHGEIKAHTDFYAMQGGATSVYSGVDTFTGKPANWSHPVPTARFPEYNDTVMVKPNPGTGIVELTEDATNKRLSNAAAILRLPFPSNPAMFEASYSYHGAVMDFDLDPARFGANAGNWSYAPTYAPTERSASDRRLHQFHNALTPLALRGQPLSKSRSKVITTAGMQMTPAGVGTNDGTAIVVPIGTAAQVMIDAPSHLTDLVKRVSIKVTRKYRTFMEVKMFTSDGDALASAISPVKYFVPSLYDPEWTSGIEWTVGSPTSDLVLSVHPGSAMYYYLTGDQTALGVLTNFANTNIDPGTTTYHAATAVVETEPHINLAANDGFSEEYMTYATDIVRLPLTSGASANRDAAKQNQEAWDQGRLLGALSLVGRRVEYPSTWSPATIASLEASYIATEDAHGTGRGLYYGLDKERFNLPVFVPGSGTSLRAILSRTGQGIDAGTTVPDVFPYMPIDPIFAQTNQVYYPQDHGGPAAYVCLGSFIAASSDEHRNQVVLNISGGPTGGQLMNFHTTSYKYNAGGLHGTAIDAFWPHGRPVLKSKK